MDLRDIKGELKSRVAKGLNFGIEAVEDVLNPASGLFNDFVLLKSKYNDLMYISSINTMPYDQIELGLDRLRKALLDMIDRIEEDSLKKQQVEQGLKVQALPTRRTNFFKLLDIHFQNLESISYVEIYGNDITEQSKGREAIFKIYQGLRRKLKSKTESQEIIAFFRDYFENDIGPFEVYFKNIKHLLSYVLDSEVERQFFLDTMKSLFSRYELAMILYYALAEIDPDFKGLVKKSGLLAGLGKSILLKEEHMDPFSCPS
ncbi:MAG: hypothetical protein H6573_27045 [Lewinellaceae bacterium]|nr:hypothetical protein [Phaeodactylibacter sp.]MCB9351132.1 hypothetical protein [Lewinellaceae bacterium]